MRLLVLTPQLPYPPHQGTTIRNFHIIKHLAPQHEITLVTFGTPEELAAAGPLRAICGRVELAPYPMRSTARRIQSTFCSPLPDMALRLESSPMHERVSAVLGGSHFDVVQVEGIEMAPYIPTDGTTLRGARLIFDDHNAEYMLQRTVCQSDAHQITRWHAALYSLIQWKKLAGYERRVCHRADWVLVASGADAQAIRELDTCAQVLVVPNGVDTDHYRPAGDVDVKPLGGTDLVFTGKMDYRPNVDAMTWFCAEILPGIRAEFERARLTIVGQKPSARVLALAKLPAVTVTGWVADTRPFIADAAIYVVPLRMGSGTRLKVLEAMAMGKAIVATTRGIEGIDVIAGRDVLVADTPSEFARAVMDLLRDPERRRTLGRSARELAESRYDWRRIVPQIEKTYAPA